MIRYHCENKTINDTETKYFLYSTQSISIHRGTLRYTCGDIDQF